MLSSRYSKIRSRGWLTSLLLTSLAALQLHAGTGTFNAGAYSFCVSVRFNATAAQLTNIQTAFTNGSKVLADATDGQQYFGTVNISNNSGCSEAAEVWLFSGTGRAFATLGKYGIRGQHLVLYYGGQSAGGSDNFDQPASPGTTYTIAHEMAHHSFGVADEYSGPAGAAHCARPPDTATLNFCLMDNYFTRGGKSNGGATYTLNEFCVKTNHDPDAVTYQTSISHKSCWETIGGHPKRAATAPAGLPNSNAPTGIADPTYRTLAGGLRVMIVVDRSGSMDSDNKLQYAKQAASLFVNSLKVDDQVGVVSFDDSPVVSFPLTQITGAGTLSAATSAINAISAGDTTNIGGALQSALTQLTNANPRGCNELIVLLTDGDHNTGTAPASVIPSITAQGVTILAVGVGSSISADGQAVLQLLASQTGGKYFGLSSSFGLLGLFFHITAESTGSGLLTRAPLALSPNATSDTPMLVEQGSSSVTFGVALSSTTANVSLSLKAPNNTVYSSDAAVTGAGGTVNRSIPNVVLYTFPNPQTGTWHVNALSGVATNIEVFGSSVNDGVKIMADTDLPSVQSPAPVTIQSTVQFGGINIRGAAVTGIVTRPDGTTVPISLLDDGSAASGDGVANDGIYTMRFNNFSVNGTYTAQLAATNTNGTFNPGELFGSPAPPAVGAPQFMRTTSVSFLVTGIDPCAVSPTQLQVNVPVSGTISSASCQNPRNNNYTKTYSFSGSSGQKVSISLDSTQFDTYLYLLNPSGQVIAYDDDSGAGTNSRIPSSGYFTLPATGTYLIYATSYGNSTGAFTITLNSASSIALNRQTLNFGYSGSMMTSMQTSMLTFAGGPAMSWTASSNRSNIAISPMSGNANTLLQITAAPGTSGTITITANGAVNSPQQIQVNSAAVTQAAPYGSFDTPINNTSGVTGAIPVTGWALDNIEVMKVDIWREPVTGEGAGGGPNGLVYIGDAVFVAGARPDVQTGNAGAPFHYRGGWGYLMLTNFLLNSSGTGSLGNGTYKIHALAHNRAGMMLDLGTRTIAVDNAHASKPFGTIDTPPQGATINGSQYVNFGWALAQNPACIPLDGSTLTAYVDSVPLTGHPVYNNNRSDIATLFPGYCNSAGAVGYYVLDTTQLTNDVHTIFWIGYDNQNRGEGLGSRYFNVLNTGTPVAAPAAERIAAVDGVKVRRGFDAKGALEPLASDASGVMTVEAEELERIELHVGAMSGYSVVDGERFRLPIGSTLRNGVFAWHLAPGFNSVYSLVFERPDGSEARVTVKVRPKSFPKARE